ncbi:MAG: carbohydrate kinase family protein [Vicinamibacterales bacterium]
MNASPAASAFAFDVIGIGAACVDIVSVVPELPETSGPRSKVRIESQTTRCGGQTATAMVACARLGLRPAFVGAVGDDLHGARVRRTLAANGVDITGLVMRSAPTASALILVPATTGERVVLWNRDSALALDPGDLSDTLFGLAPIVHVDDVDLEVSVRVAARARRAGAIVTTDIDQTRPDVLTLVEHASFAIFTDHVAPALTGEPDVARAATVLAERYRTAVCVTLGAEGALMCQDGRVERDSGFRVDAIDTTGAGDVFRAGFIYGLRQGWTGAGLLAFANAAAALSCARAGAIDGAPTLAEVVALVASRASSPDADVRRGTLP